MTALLPVARTPESLPIIVPPAGLVHSCDRNDLSWIKKHGKGRYALLISSTFIKRRTAELAREIAVMPRKSKIKQIHLLFVLRGAAFFGCSLAREIFAAGGNNITIHFVNALSYGKASHSCGRCRLVGDLHALRGKDVVIIDDICDTGLTLDTLKNRLLFREQAASVKACVLLDKPARRLDRLKEKPLMDFIGFQIPNVFVAGCGLEYGEFYRELPFLIAIKGTGVL